MKKATCFGLGLFAALMGCAHSTAKAAHAPDPVNDATNVTVALVNEGAPFCTGTWVSQGWILTASHCVDAAAEDSGSPPVGTKIHFKRFEMDKDWDAVAMYVDADHDLALLQTLHGQGPGPHAYAFVAGRGPGVGAPLHFVGMPAGLWWTYSTGQVTAVRDRLGGMVDYVGPWLQVDAPIWFGNSGGGGFDASGHLVGVVSFKHGRMPLCAFLVGTDTIRSFVAAHVR